jgi:hypothetical protein
MNHPDKINADAKDLASRIKILRDKNVAAEQIKNRKCEARKAADRES